MTELIGTESEKKDTLLSLLTDLENVDNGLIEFDPETHREVILKTSLKIDNYKYMLTKYDSRISEIAAEIAELTIAKSTLQKKQDALKAMMLYAFQEKSIDKFPGERYVASRISKEVVVIKQQPDPRTYLAYPNLVRREYSWDKRAFDSEFKTNESLKDFATVEKSEYIKFNLIKGVSND